MSFLKPTAVSYINGEYATIYVNIKSRSNKQTKTMKYTKYFIGLMLAMMFLSPTLSSAQTVEELQAQLNGLLQILSGLQAQVGISTAAPISANINPVIQPTTCNNFASNLRTGSSGTQVTTLQQTLQAQGFNVPQGELMGATYGTGTTAAVTLFQEKYANEVLVPNNLSVGNGFVGPSTRTVLNRIAGCGVPPLQTNIPGGIINEQYPVVSLQDLNALAVVKSADFGIPTVVAGGTNIAVGSYTFFAPSGLGEGANLTAVTVRIGNGGSSLLYNLKLRERGSGVQLGVNIPTIISNADYTFNFNSNIPSGGSKIIDVYADILNSAVSVSGNTYPALTTLANCVGTTAQTAHTLSCRTTPGQDVKVANMPPLSISGDTSLSPSNYLTMGSSGNTLAAFRFIETQNIEDLKIYDLTITQSIADSSVKSSFQNLQLFDGSTLLGTAHSPAITFSPAGYSYRFSFATPVVIPRANSVLLALKGDVLSYSSSGASDNTTHIFKIAAPQDVTAYGAVSNSIAATSLISARGNIMTVLRTKLNFTSQPFGSSSGRAKQPVDNLALLNLGADIAGSLAVNKIVVTFEGTAPANPKFLDGVNIIDENGSPVAISVVTSTPCNGSNTCSKTFNLGTGVSGQLVSQGTIRGWILRVDSTKTQAGTSGISQTLTASISARDSILFTDGLNFAATKDIPLSPNLVFPLMINRVNYAVGSLNSPTSPPPSTMSVGGSINFPPTYEQLLLPNVLSSLQKELNDINEKLQLLILQTARSQ